MNTPPRLTMTTFLDASQSPISKLEFIQRAARHASTPSAMEAEQIASCPRPSREESAAGPEPTLHPHPRGSPRDHEEGPTPCPAEAMTHRSRSLRRSLRRTISGWGTPKNCMQRPQQPPEAQNYHRATDGDATCALDLTPATRVWGGGGGEEDGHTERICSLGHRGMTACDHH
jgi:hypothetical protein